MVAVVLILVGVGVWYYQSTSNNQIPMQQTNNSSSSNPVAGAGEHCGGNIVNAPVCGSGYECQPDPSSTLPFGDVGGICVAVQAQGGY